MEALWFALWGLLWAIYFMLDGFDLGVGMLLPFLGRDETARRAMLRSIGPFWDGNEVWLITAGGVTFAAFPTTYAVMFSSLYAPLLLILFGLIFRGVAMEFRRHGETAAWKSLWDTCAFLGSTLPALLLGVAFANIFQGIPLDAEHIFHGTILTLLNPYGLLGGALFVLLFLVHGANWLAARTGGDLQKSAGKAAAGLWPPLTLAAVAFLVATWFSTKLYDNYLARKALFLVPLVTVAALLLTRAFQARQAWWKAWAASAVTIFGATAFGVIGLFPNLLPSSINTKFSLTAYNSSSSPMTLKIMLIVALIFIPLILVYQIWAYLLFKNPVTSEDLNEY